MTTETKDVTHIADKICRCEYCLMIDVIYGDPLLSEWERNFIDSVARQGWHRDDYSEKQKAVIKRIFKRQRHKYGSDVS